MFPQQPGGIGVRESFNIFYILVRGYAACVGIFLRRRFGGEALGFPGVAAVLIMVVYMAAHPESKGMSSFFCLWWIVLAFQRLGHFNRRREGIILHSQFDGESLVGVALPSLNFSDLPRVLDTLICLGAGWAIQKNDAALGTFIFWGGVALFIKGLIDKRTEDQHLQRMYDAEIEQRSRLARWQSGRF